MRREMKLKFSDGVIIDTAGPLRKLHLEDGGMSWATDFVSQ
jgi:hypothetical protein